MLGLGIATTVPTCENFRKYSLKDSFGSGLLHSGEHFCCGASLCAWHVNQYMAFRQVS